MSIVDRKLRHLQDRVAYLRSRQDVTLDAFLADQTVQLAVERAFQEAVEAGLDIGRRLLLDAGVALPDRNREMFRMLAALGVVAPEAVPRLADMASFRNLLVHAYDRVDPRRVHEALVHRLSDLEGFGAAVVGYLSGKDPGA
jgi:uncharacterized protein YutE (UPF0331/DUF86 family)